MLKYFFDIPVYRLTRDKYYLERDEYIDKTLYPMNSAYSEQLRIQDEKNPNRNDAFKNHLENYYGGCWEFNEIIGYIRLHFLGSQVRGEYFGVNKKRIIRTRKKTFEYKTWKLAPEVDITFPLSQSGILKATRDYIQDCKKELPNRYIDDSMFETLAKHINWMDCFK